MSIFSSKKEPFFSADEQKQIVASIQKAEKNTSGEVRIFIESKCEYVDPVERAKEVFFSLKMEQTEQRNAVLMYMAMEDHQLALFGDEGIHQRLGEEFWQAEVKKIILEIKQDHLVDGVCKVIEDIGMALQAEFPYHDEDRNELPDEIIFGD